MTTWNKQTLAETLAAVAAAHPQDQALVISGRRLTYAELRDDVREIALGLRALGIGPGDEVIIVTGNFVACASAIVDMGARPVFADVDPRTLNILPAEIDRLRTPRTLRLLLARHKTRPEQPPLPGPLSTSPAA